MLRFDLISSDFCINMCFSDLQLSLFLLCRRESGYPLHSFIQTENKNKTHRSQTIVTKMAVEKLNTTVDGVEILKPRTDNREYRKIVLKNSLQVLLISDPDTDKKKCAASMSVSIRSFSDPQGLEGLAHLPATVNVASSPHSGTVSRLVQCSHSANLMWFGPIRTSGCLTLF
ncbi:hypothetical protein YC2023_001312 [Brassica napus]